MEFTIEDGRLFMLQTRRAQRSGQAAFRVACEMVDEELISEEEAVARAVVHVTDHQVVATRSNFPDWLVAVSLVCNVLAAAFLGRNRSRRASPATALGES